MNKTGDNLFDNPMVTLARKSMPKEQLDRLEKIGKQMYESIDYETSIVAGQTFPKDMAESVAYVVEGIKAGLHPSDLSDGEKNLLLNVYGEKWYERFGYDERDLHEIYTVAITKKIKYR